MEPGAYQRSPSSPHAYYPHHNSGTKPCGLPPTPAVLYPLPPYNIIHTSTHVPPGLPGLAGLPHNEALRWSVKGGGSLSSEIRLDLIIFTDIEICVYVPIR